MKAYNLICNTKELLKKSSEVYDLFQAQKSLKTAESYKQYYEDAGKLFSNAVSVMGVVTSILPRGGVIIATSFLLLPKTAWKPLTL